MPSLEGLLNSEVPPRGVNSRKIYCKRDRRHSGRCNIVEISHVIGSDLPRASRRQAHTQKLAE
jgi:hypothetical protein